MSGKKIINLDDINQRITDRSDSFYWQTDRKISVAEAGDIWADRHFGINDDLIKEKANKILTDRIVNVEPINPDSQNNLGNVNSVREVILESGRPALVRCHPLGVKNGYFYAESLAADIARKSGLPTYETYAIGEASNLNDISFQVIQKMPGIATKIWGKLFPDNENNLLHDAGSTMAKLHQIKTKGYGPFNNELAKQGKLVGLHENFIDSVRAGLEFNLGVLQEYETLTSIQAQAIDELFGAGNNLLQSRESVLIHNDFADWNLLTDGQKITAILDWDECASSNPISDIACWSTFFEPERMERFLAGYFSVVQKQSNFNEMFELMRLRYTVSKMTLRLRRYNWNRQPAMLEKIKIGKQHLKTSLQYFKISGR